MVNEQPYLTHAVLLAGGRLTSSFAREADTEIKALIRVGGRTLLERAVEAMRGAGVGKVVVVGPEEVRNHTDAAFVPEGGGGIENLYRAIEQLKGSAGDRLLISATDLPFITAEAIGALLEAAPDNCSLVVPILRREEFAARFPEAPATYVRLSDGWWTSASVFLVETGMLSSMRPRLESLFAARKSQMGMARLLGPLCTVKFLTRRLGVDDIERRARTLLGCEGAALRDCPPELAFDVDLPEEYRYAYEQFKMPYTQVSMPYAEWTPSI